MSDQEQPPQEPKEAPIDETGQLDEVGETLREPREEGTRNTEDRPLDTW